MTTPVKLTVQWTKNTTGILSIFDADKNGDGMLLFQDTGNFSQHKVREKMLKAGIAAIHPDESDVATLYLHLENRLMVCLQDRMEAMEAEQPQQVPTTSPPSTGNIAEWCNDTANAYRLVSRYGGKLHYIPEWGKWIIWDGKSWRKDETEAIVRMAKATAKTIFDEAKDASPESAKRLAKHAVKSLNERQLRAMVALAQSELAKPAKELDANPWLFCCQNGTVDLRTGQLQPHTAADLITKISQVRYDPSMPCPTFDAFLQRIMDNNHEMIAYLLRLLGYALTGDIRHHILPIFWGDGANGKSTLMDLVMHIMGEHAIMAPDSLLTVRQNEEHPTDMADLAGRRLAVASETDEAKRLRIAQVKRLTGDEFIKARYMRQDYFQFRRTHKTILITNNKPRITEDSNAIWRRIKLLHFDVVIPLEEQDPDLPAKLRLEAPGILARLVQGCLEWLRFGNDLREPEQVKRDTFEYRGDEDPLAEYLAKHIIMNAQAFVSREDIWRDYREWAMLAGNKFPLGNRQFYDKLRKLPGVTDGSNKINGQAVRVFRGIGLALSRFPQAA